MRELAKCPKTLKMIEFMNKSIKDEARRFKSTLLWPIILQSIMMWSSVFNKLKPKKKLIRSNIPWNSSSWSTTMGKCIRNSFNYQIYLASLVRSFLMKLNNLWLSILNNLDFMYGGRSDLYLKKSYREISK